jgi:beta-glucosidase-like glycosyl hydrolase
MTIVEVPAKLTVDDLVTAVDQLPNQELNAFVRRVLALQAQRGLTVLEDEQEQGLLTIIENQQLSPERRQRLAHLRLKSREGTLTPSEHAELLQFVQQVEQQDLIRLEAMIELAQKRGISLADLLRDLGIEPSHA